MIAAVSASLSACATAGEPTVSTAGMPGALEPIHAAAFTKDQAVFWVSSNGCTRKEDLIPIVSLQGGNAVNAVQLTCLHKGFGAAQHFFRRLEKKPGFPGEAVPQLG